MARYSTCALLLLLAALLHPTQGQQDAGTTAQPASTNGTIEALVVNLTNPVLQEQVDRFLSILDGRDTPIYNETEYQERFSSSFVDAAPLTTAMVPIVNNLQATAEAWMVIEVAQEQTNAAVLVLAPEQQQQAEAHLIAWSISIDPTNGQITGFLLSDASDVELETIPTSTEEAVAQINDLGHNFHYVVADVVITDDPQQDLLHVVEGQAADTPAPLGSMFKLWVLAAVIDSMEKSDNSSIQWDQNVTVTEQAKSLPSGVVQDDPVGNQRTVRELAELMIQVSDNTATDLLLHLVGRTVVEQAMVETGHHNPSLNIPFLSTKELFLLKLDGAMGDGRPGPLGEEFVAGTVDERRAILADLENVTIASRDLDIVKAWAGGPIAVEDLEWFASPMDLCQVLARLYRHEEARRILALNQGVPDEQSLWSYIGFKGGSEPGVLGLAWYVVPNDDDQGSHRAVAGTVWNPNSVIEETPVSLLMGHVRDLQPATIVDSDGSGISRSLLSWWVLVSSLLLASSVVVV